MRAAPRKGIATKASDLAIFVADGDPHIGGDNFWLMKRNNVTINLIIIYTYKSLFLKYRQVGCLFGDFGRHFVELTEFSLTSADGLRTPPVRTNLKGPTYKIKGGSFN